MLRNVVGTAFAGFQKAAVSGEYDERDQQLRSMRQDLRNLEGVVRQLLIEVGSLRAELNAARAQGLPSVEPLSAGPGVPPKTTDNKPQSQPEGPQSQPEPPGPQSQPTGRQAPTPAPSAPASAPPEKRQAAEPEAPLSFAALAAQAAAGQLNQNRHADDHSTDLDGYRERMRANGRDGVQLSGEGLNTAPDGAPFIGPVDNESSRAKAVGKVLTIDQWECISCGTCVEQTADVFFLPDGEKAEVLKQEGPMDLVQDAIDACPVTCISWLEKAKIAEQHSAGGFK